MESSLDKRRKCFKIKHHLIAVTSEGFVLDGANILVFEKNLKVVEAPAG
jgi:hypothetical protein